MLRIRELLPPFRRAIHPARGPRRSANDLLHLCSSTPAAPRSGHGRGAGREALRSLTLLRAPRFFSVRFRGPGHGHAGRLRCTPAGCEGYPVPSARACTELSGAPGVAASPSLIGQTRPCVRTQAPCDSATDGTDMRHEAGCRPLKCRSGNLHGYAIDSFRSVLPSNRPAHKYNPSI